MKAKKAEDKVQEEQEKDEGYEFPAPQPYKASTDYKPDDTPSSEDDDDRSDSSSGRKGNPNTFDSRKHGKGMKSLLGLFDSTGSSTSLSSEEGRPLSFI